MLQLVIGNKNYSSWSMRPWVLMRQLGLHFEEVKLRFDFDANSPFRRAVAHYSPAGLVPVLLDGECRGSSRDLEIRVRPAALEVVGGEAWASAPVAAL